MLTGKAKKDFERWKFMNSHTYIYALPESFMITLILEWFRNDVYFHLQIYPYGNKINWCYNITDWKNDPDLFFYDRLSALKLREDREDEMFSSYEEATKEAIKMANELYNKRVASI